jgi:chromosomal replication initiation ATPase DnaA
VGGTVADGNGKQLALELPASTSYQVEDYVVAACNQLAHDRVRAWPDWPHFALGLSGPAGAGKTHLAHIWAEAAGAGIADVARLRAAGPDALTAATPRWAVELDRAGDSFSPDDERALFHFHNLIHAADGGALLYVSRRPLLNLPIALPDLVSRLAVCLAVEVSAPDDAVLRAVMAKLAADRQITLSEAVVDVVLQRTERSFAAVAGVVRAIDAAALAGRRQITRDLALEVLAALAHPRYKGVDEG